MTRKAWWLVASAYVLLALGVLTSQILLARQQNTIDQQTDRLAAAAGIYCEIGRLPDTQERVALDALAHTRLDGSVLKKLSAPSCRLIYERLHSD